MQICTTCARESPAGFAFCPACGTALDPVDPAREVRKIVTLVFCDLAGSTSLGERLDAESLRDVQTRYFETMRVAIERHGGTVEKYIGDAVVAVFGIPRIHEDDALRAARAAIEMRDGLAALNTSLERDRGVTIRLRIGVNTGEVVAGDPTAGQALVTGDAVNVAARLEQHAAPGEILLGANTYRLVRTAVRAEPVAPLDVKGKAEPLSAWRLLDAAAVPTGAPRRQGSTMVGRDPELTQLRATYATAIETRSCQLFTLLGSGGLGKSRLVEEFVSDLGDEATVALGVCLPYGEGITYYPIVEAIKGAAGLTDLDGPDAVDVAISSVIEGDEHRALVSRNLSSLISSTGSVAIEETFWAVRRFFEAVASERALVLVFDDIQWGESTFLDLVEHFADLSRGSPILLLCMARPELLDVRPTWGSGKPNAETASLAPLTQDQAETLVANLLGSSERPAWLTTEIVGRAEGNPLFLEETFGMLVDDGLLVSGEEGWTAVAELADVAVPPSISALLAARLDRLTPHERAVIEAAAVVGREFSISVVRDLLPEDAHDRVPSDLMALVRKELVQLEHASLPGEDAMRFRHLLIRDAAYEAIAKTRRAELHERVADRLEERRDGEGEHEEIVGYHLERAWTYRTLLGPPDERSDAIGTRAAGRLASAGRRAAGRGDAPAAVNLLRRALKVGSPNDTGRADILFHLGIALAESGDTVSAIAALDEATLLAEARGERSVEWLARINGSDLKGEVNPHSLSTDVLVEELHTAIRTFEELGDEAGLASAWQILAFSEFMPCRFDRAEQAARRGVTHARASGDERLLTEAVRTMCFALAFGSTTPEAGKAALDELSDDVARSRSIEASALSTRAWFASMEGSYDEGRRLAWRAVEIEESLGSRLMVAINHEVVAAVELAAGNVPAAERATRIKYDIFEETGHEGFRSTAAAELALCLCALGRFDEAEGYAAIARDLAAEDDMPSQSAGRQAQALVLASRGEFEAAEQLGREAIQLLEDAEAPQAQGRLSMDLARVLRMAGKSAEAENNAREAIAFFERKGDRSSITSARAFLAEA